MLFPSPIPCPTIGAELIAYTPSPGGTAHQSCNIDKVKLGFYDLRAATDLGNFIKSFIGHRHLAHIGCYGAERIIGRLLRLRLSKRIEKRRLADIGKTNDAATKTHSLLPLPYRGEGREGGRSARPC